MWRRCSDWVVFYAKAPFGGPDRVLDYLGRYTHRVAISNHRLKELKDSKVTFAYKDYKHEQRQKLMTVSADEFLRRFLLHVLPDSFQRIRHYGLLGNRHRAEHLARCRELLAMLPPVPQPTRNYRSCCQQLTGIDPLRCPKCKNGIAVATNGTVLPSLRVAPDKVRTCAICQTAIGADAVAVRCPSCRQLYHRDCWAEVGGTRATSRRIAAGNEIGLIVTLIAQEDRSAPRGTPAPIPA